MNRVVLAVAFTVSATYVAVPVRGQDPALLDAARITSAEFAPARFGPARWVDGGHYATLEAGADGRTLELVRYEAVSGAREVVADTARLSVPGREQPLQIEDYAFSPDRSLLLVFTDSQRVWRQNTRGEYWLVPLAGNQPPRRLGGGLPKSSLMFCKFAPQGDRVAYVAQNDLYVEQVAGGHQTRLSTDGSVTTINGTFDWVYEEEFDCRDGFRWSPDGTRIAYWQLDCRGVGEFYMIDNLSDRYARIVPVQYPKAGTTNSACRVGVIPAVGGATVWMKTPGEPRETYVPRMEWHPAGKELMVQWLPRAQNELRVLACAAATGEARVVLTETDAAYVDVRDDFRWLEDGKRFFWTSDRDGWRHAWAQPWTDGEARLLTPGDYDVIDVVHADLDKGQLYFARAHRATERQLAALLPDGVAFVTNEWRESSKSDEKWAAVQSGWHDYQVSTDGTLAIHTASSFDSPPVVDLVRLPSHERVRVLEDNAPLRERYQAVQRGSNEFFKVSLDDGAILDGWTMYPPDFDSTRSWPVLFHVYGEPWSQTVKDTWFLNHHLFHRWMTQRGYVVMSIDARGTPAPKGRDWRKALYQRIGVLSSADWDQAVAALGKRHSWMDRTRLAIWGWSGGGAMTLNMLFRYPERFAAGMSVAPVTDIGLYDTIYQERYCGDPRKVPEVYRECSPITFAQNLQGHLLLVHGTGDDNVHFQHSERLFDALVAADKQFEYLAYPNRTHAIREGKNTRRHLYGALADFLQRRVPPGPRQE
ncbi:MAG: DPP IV N-terminal domain-containing protein [Planctomycetota bacterium]